LKFSVKVTLKKDVLDPQGKVVHQTLQSMGMDTVKNLRQGKYFEIDIEENNELKAKNKIEEICKKLLVNLIIEDFEISKI
jgi:phosphoribosylformylglycinamidine synthase subunit PurS